MLIYSTYMFIFLIKILIYFNFGESNRVVLVRQVNMLPRCVIAIVVEGEDLVRKFVSYKVLHLMQLPQSTCLANWESCIVCYLRNTQIPTVGRSKSFKALEFHFPPYTKPHILLH